MFFFVRFRFFDNPQVDSHQILYAGALWFRMCLLPFRRLAVPRGAEKGKIKFSWKTYVECEWRVCVSSTDALVIEVLLPLNPASTCRLFVLTRVIFFSSTLLFLFDVFVYLLLQINMYWFGLTDCYGLSHLQCLYTASRGKNSCWRP